MTVSEDQMPMLLAQEDVGQPRARASRGRIGMALTLAALVAIGVAVGRTKRGAASWPVESRGAPGVVQLLVVEASPWKCQHYIDDQDNDWCKTVGQDSDYEYKFVGPDSDACGECWCCKKDIKHAIETESTGDATASEKDESKDHGAFRDSNAKKNGQPHSGNSHSGHASEKKPPHGRRGSFLVVGDWGYDPQSHWENINDRTCVKAIAAKMLETMQKLGDVRFVINVGDSFYPSGVSSRDDPQWQTKWRDVFAPALRSVPWYSVYGNHDLHLDPCTCTDDLSQCAQINADPENLDFFQMPNYTYYQPVPDLDMEIIGLDMNHFMSGWDQKHEWTPKGGDCPDCQYTPCKEGCLGRMRIRMGASMDLFYNRVEKSGAKNLLVFSHYPTDYFLGDAPFFLDSLRDQSKHNITYFGGHRHSTDTWSTCSIEPNTNWLVGGGGGWSCDSDDQGFVVGEISEDYSVKTYAELVDKEVCCLPPTTTSTTTAAEIADFM